MPKLITEHRPAANPKGHSLWVPDHDHEMLFDLARAEERAYKVILHRAIVQYAERSEDYQSMLRGRKHMKDAARKRDAAAA